MTSDDYKRLADRIEGWMIDHAMNGEGAIFDLEISDQPMVISALRLAAEPVKAGEPVAWRWRYEDWDSWLVRQERPRHADDVDVVCEPLYAAPPASDLLREALNIAHGKFCKIAGTEAWTDSCLDGWRRSPGAVRDYAEQAAKEIDIALAANQSDGGGKLAPTECPQDRSCAREPAGNTVSSGQAVPGVAPGPSDTNSAEGSVSSLPSGESEPSVRLALPPADTDYADVTVDEVALKLGNERRKYHGLGPVTAFSLLDRSWDIERAQARALLDAVKIGRR